MAILTVQKFNGLEEMEVYFDWATRLNGNQWECDSLQLFEFSRELMALDYSEFDDPKVVGILVKRLQGAVSKALKETGGWRTPTTNELNVKQGEETLGTLGLCAVSNTDDMNTLRFKSGEEITITVTMANTAIGLNLINYKGGNWEMPSSFYNWKWFGGSKD